MICARSCWTWMRTWSGSPGGVQAARAVSAAISLDHAYGEGLYAVSDYLYEVQEKNARRPGPVPGAGKRGAVTSGRGKHPSPANFQKQLFILNKDTLLLWTGKSVF